MASRSTRRRDRSREAGPPLSPLPPPVKEAEGAWRFALPLLLALYLIFAGLHARYAPTGATGYQNAPDEAAHVAYVRSLAQGHLPTQASSAADPQAYEWHQPPLYYALTSLVASSGYSGMRWISILCGCISILLIYRASRLLFPESPIVAVFAAGVASLLPEHIAITSTVNNDALLEVGFSATLLALFIAMKSGFTLWRAGWIGLFLGLTILTKATGLLLLPVFAFGLFLMWRGGEKSTHLFKGAVWSLTLILVVSGWWFARNGQLYGEWLPLQAFQRAFAQTAQAATMAEEFGGWGEYRRIVAQWSFQSFWAVYGTERTATNGVPVFLPEQIYLLFGVLTLVAVGGLTRAHFRRRVDFTESQLACIWILFAVFGLVAFSFVAFLTKYFQTQGRYLYPAMMPIAILLAIGWKSAIPARYLPIATAGVLSVFCLSSLAFIRYALPNLF